MKFTTNAIDKMLKKQKDTAKKPIKSIDQLKELANNDYGVDCYILLKGGLTSTKLIQYFGGSDEWYVFNLIDSSSDEYSSTGEFKKSNVYEALEIGALIKEF